MSLGPLSIDVATLRWSSLTGLLVCLLFGFGGVAVEARARAQGEAAYIEVLHGARLIPVRDLPLGRNDDVVDLAAFDALLAIGRRLDLPVMVEAPRPGSRSRTTRYYVNDGPTTYRYVATNGRDEQEDRDGRTPAGDTSRSSASGGCCRCWRASASARPRGRSAWSTWPMASAR